MPALGACAWPPAEVAAAASHPYIYMLRSSCITNGPRSMTRPTHTANTRRMWQTPCRLCCGGCMSAWNSPKKNRRNVEPAEAVHELRTAPQHGGVAELPQVEVCAQSARAAVAQLQRMYNMQCVCTRCTMPACCGLSVRITEPSHKLNMVQRVQTCCPCVPECTRLYACLILCMGGPQPPLQHTRVRVLQMPHG